MGNPYALNITMWIGNAGSVYSNAPGANIASSATPAIVNYFGTFGIKNGTQGNVNPVNVITSPATGIFIWLRNCYCRWYLCVCRYYC